MDDEVWFVRAPTIGYEAGLAVQRELAEARREGSVPDLLLTLEHYPVYTKGRRTEPAELPMGEEWYRMQGIEVCETDRGGRVTYHGPGQLVAYPIVDLGPYGDDVEAYVRRLERVMIDSLTDWGVPAQVFAGLTGVWTAGEAPVTVGDAGPQGTRVGPGELPADPGQTARKIGSIGIHVRRGITTHGLAINVANDLQPFEWIVPCGIDHCRVSSLTRERGSEQDVGEFAEALAEHFSRICERRRVDVELGELAAAGPNVQALGNAASTR